MKRKVFVVSHTHWDREWNQPFQLFRKRLVDMMDELIDVLETDPEYRYFHFDGQTIVLEDYLEIRPENQARLGRLIREGRLVVGPWYNMPDEALPSGESLIRNLAKGHAIARRFGAEAMKVGYVTDIFGHTSQFPQILKGFGIDSAVLFRGMGDFLQSEFHWESPDGSRVLALKRDEDRGYSDFYFAVRWPFFGRDCKVSELKDRYLAHLAYIEERASTPLLLMMDGVDNIDVETRLPWMLDVLREAEPDTEIVHALLEEYVGALEKEAGTLPVFFGELREPGSKGMNNLVLSNVLSSRVPLKQYNQRCENLLQNWCEPWSVFRQTGHDPSPKSYLDLAWTYLLKNHPHDSIGGCSMTEVHRDMMYRFDQCHHIGGMILDEGLRQIAERTDTSSIPGSRALVLFNPCQEHFDGTLTADIEVPARPDAPAPFRLYDADGREVPCQILSLGKRQVNTLFHNSLFPQAEVVDRYGIAFHASVPSFGCSTFSYDFSPSDHAEPFAYAFSPERIAIRHPGTQRSGRRSMENEFLSVIVNSEGTIDLLDKATGRWFRNVFSFEDEADIGDGWVHRVPVANAKVLGPSGAADVSIVHDGPYQTTLRIGLGLTLPVGADPDASARKEQTRRVPIVTEITMRKGSRRIDCRTEVDNCVEDHRLRLIVPTGMDTNEYYTNTAFDFNRRPIVRRDYSQYREENADVVPNHGITALRDETGGIALLNRGLYEVQVRDDADRTIALTLFRSTGNEVTNITHAGGQLLEKLVFEYSLIPFSGNDVFPGEILKAHQAYERGFASRLTGRHAGIMPMVHSFLEVRTDNVVLTAVMQADKDAATTIVRMYNGGTKAETVTMKDPEGIMDASVMDLLETSQDTIPAREGTIAVDVGPGKIVTIGYRRRADGKQASES